MIIIQNSIQVRTTLDDVKVQVSDDFVKPSLPYLFTSPSRVK